MNPLREMTEQDCPAVWELDCQLFTGDEWPSGHFFQELLQGFGLIYGELEGYILVYEGPEFAEVLRIGVRPECRRRGVARSLLAAALKRTVCPRMTLLVRCRNVGAISLYRSMGFVPVGVNTDYYRDGEDGLAMLR